MPQDERDTDRLYTDEPDEEDLVERLPDDLDPHQMADSVPDEIAAEEGQGFGLDPDLAVFASRDELDDPERP